MKYPEWKQNMRISLVKSYAKANWVSRTAERCWTVNGCFRTLEQFVTERFIPYVQSLELRRTAKLRFSKGICVMRLEGKLVNMCHSQIKLGFIDLGNSIPNISALQIFSCFPPPLKILLQKLLLSPGTFSCLTKSFSCPPLINSWCINTFLLLTMIPPHVLI